MEMMNTVVERILMMMERRNINRSELAQRIGWPMSKMSKVLSGNQKITTDDLISIAVAMGTNPALLVSPDMSDVVYDKKSVMYLSEIFQKISYSLNDKQMLANLIENELPYTMNTYLCLKETGKTVDVMLRRKRVNRVEDEFIAYPRVTITDKSEGQLFSNQLTIGYWFDEDWKGVYIAIHYIKGSFSRAGTNIKTDMDKNSMTTTKDMRELFIALAGSELNCLEKMRLGERSSRNHVMYEAGTIFCKRYELVELYPESVLKSDLQKIYDLYLELLDKATKRVQETYENIYQHRREKDRKEFSELSSDKFEIADLDRIMPVDVSTSKYFVRRYRDVRVALEREGYKCEINTLHETFTDRKTEKPYMQIHALIPMSMQNEFKQSLQMEANYCALCPLCHAKLEHGTDAERQELLMHLYMKHKEGLKAAGIEITLMQLFKYYGMS